MNFGALSRGFGTCCLRFKNGVATIPARLASGWLARLCREGVDPLDRCKRFQLIHPPFLDLAWRKGSFISTLPLASLHSITSSARFRARSRIARCEVRYNREKVLLVEIGYNLGHQRAPFSRSGAVLEVIELPEHVAR